MGNITIFHGTKGSPDINWFNYIKNNSELSNYKISVPQMPTPENQNPGSWFSVIDETGIIFNENSTVIGHSCGATFLLHLLERHSIYRAIFVSPVMDKIGILEYDSLNMPFINKAFDYTKIKNNSQKTLIFHGDNDPYVPLWHAEKLSQEISAPLEIIKNGGHLNFESGYTQFPRIIEEILK